MRVFKHVSSPGLAHLILFTLHWTSFCLLFLSFTQVAFPLTTPLLNPFLSHLYLFLFSYIFLLVLFTFSTHVLFSFFSSSFPITCSFYLYFLLLHFFLHYCLASSYIYTNIFLYFLPFFVILILHLTNLNILKNFSYILSFHFIVLLFPSFKFIFLHFCCV